jgi:uncharacterized protein
MARTKTIDTTTARTISIEAARRLALTAQGLSAASRPPGPVDSAALEAVVRRINYVQLDPISVVARSPLLVLWSRVGCFAPSVLEECLFAERTLFEFFTHGAAIVPTADLALYRWRMHRYPVHDRMRKWLADNAELGEAILTRLAAEGPLPAQAFEERAARSWESSGWTHGRNTEQMLAVLWRQGKVVVAGRAGGKRRWQLASTWFPPGAGAEAVDEEVARRRLFARTLIASGVATARQVGDPAIARALVASGEVVPVAIESEPGLPLKGEWLMHSDQLANLERIEAGEWEGRSVLLSPFDNLNIDRGRAEALFGFEHRMEIYVPPPKRRWGYYVLPYLHGDRFAGRFDLRVDRKGGRLSVLAAYAEPWAARPPGGLRPLRRALEELASCCGAGSVVIEPGACDNAPSTWSKALS